MSDRSFWLYFVMVPNGDGSSFRSGPAYRSRDLARSWLPFVSARYHTRATVRGVLICFDSTGHLLPELVDRLSNEFNLDVSGCSISSSDSLRSSFNEEPTNADVADARNSIFSHAEKTQAISEAGFAGADPQEATVNRGNRCE